jgi:SNF2 family DNA or RNA helicase
MTNPDRGHLTARARLYRERQDALEGLLAGKLEPRPCPLAVPLRRYQQVVPDLTLRFGGLLCADDMGLGKTASAIGLLAQAEARPALVVTLTHLPEQWRDEIRRFAPSLSVRILDGTTPYDLRLPKGSRPGQRALAGVELPDVIVTGYSKLAGWARYLAPIVRSAVWDECQELRHKDSQKYDGARLIGDAASYRLGLSGTPIYNYGDEIHNVLECIRPGELGTRAEFLREWCTGEDSKGRASIGDPAAFGTFVREAGLMLRRTRSEVGRELPPRQRCIHYIDCDADKLNEISGAAGELARIILSQQTEAKGEKFRAAQELSIMLRKATGVAKAPYVAEFVRMLVETGERLVLFGWHHEVYGIWRERFDKLGIPWAMFSGEESQRQKRDSLQRFKAGEAKVLIMSLRAGAGIDGLQHVCSTVVFGEIDWSPGVHEQDETRVFRDGQTKPFQAYYPLATDGSDPIIADILGIKRNQIDGLRDPYAAVVEEAPTDDRIKRLAEAYLTRHAARASSEGARAVRDGRVVRRAREVAAE